MTNKLHALFRLMPDNGALFKDLYRAEIDSLIQEIKQEPVSNNERNYAIKKMERLKKSL